MLNKVRRRARLARDARDALRSIGINVMHAAVRDLDVFKLAPQGRTTVWNLGRAGQQGTDDLDEVFGELLKLTGLHQEVATHG